MNYLKSKATLLCTLLIVFSFQSLANINDANWYVSIDIDQIESNEIFKALDMKSDKSSDDFFLNLEKIPDEISYISFYGDAKRAQDATAIIQGDFSDFSINEYVLNFLYTQDDISQLIKESTLKYKGNEIQVLKIMDYDGQPDDSPKKAYFAKVNNGLSVISFQLDEIYDWLNHDYDNHDFTKGSLFSVVVDVQSALAHMGINIDENDHMMQSQIFQKVTQASASLSEVNNDMLIEIALTATDETTATQVELVINGLIAMSGLSGVTAENEIQSKLLANLKVERDGNNILINTYASREELMKIASKQNY